MVDPACFANWCVGGSDYGHHTLTRFFAVHAGVLAGAVGVLSRFCTWRCFGGMAFATRRRSNGPDATFWPDQVLKDAVACSGGIGGRAVFDHAAGDFRRGPCRPIRRPWGPNSAPRPIRPMHIPRPAPNGISCFCSSSSSCSREWARQGEFFGAIIVPGLVMTLMFSMPIFGRWKLGHRFNIAFTLLLLAGIGWLTVSAYREDHRANWASQAQRDAIRQTGQLLRQFGGDEKKIGAILQQGSAEDRRISQAGGPNTRNTRSPPDYLQAVARAEDEVAERAKELAGRSNGIPPAGGWPC